MSDRRIMVRPKPGQFLLFVDLGEIESHSLAERLRKLEELDFYIDVEYEYCEDGIRLYALLINDEFRADHRIPDDYRLEDRLRVFQAFEGEEDLVYCRMGKP